MGAAKKRKQAFFREHARCCFCGGSQEATTIDHVPMRAAFAGNIGPEGFEFPACAACNRGTSGSEQVFALYVRLLDQIDENYDQALIGTLIRGVRNNYPRLLPNPRLGASSKRRALRHYGWELERGQLLDDVSLVGVPEQFDEHARMNVTKLLAALYYRHTGAVVSDASGVLWGWSQQGLPGVDEAQDVLFDGMPELVIGKRTNTSIGDQFAYRWGVNAEEGLFGFAAGFGAGLFVFGASAPWGKVSQLENWERFGPPRSPQP